MKEDQIFTNVYGIARSLLALGLLLTLVLNDIHLLLPQENYDQQVKDQLAKHTNLFLIFDYKYILLVKILACLSLIWVISGYNLYITGLLQFWINYSFFNAINAVEGGDQISVGLSALLIPVTLVDNRVNHWGSKLRRRQNPFIANYFAKSCFFMIRLQMSLLYFDAGVEKLKVKEWADGTATYYWFTHHSFGATSWLLNIAGPLFQYGWFVSLVTWSVIILEVMLFAAIFMKHAQKRVLFAFGLLFHSLIALVHGLPSFGLAMTGGLILYLIPIDNYINFNKWKHVFRSRVLSVRSLVRVNKLPHVEA